jgi:hypothetical protein
MPVELPEPRHLPCPECGVSLVRSERDEHACEHGDLARYEAFQLRAEVECFEEEWRAFLDSPQGAFAVWAAERERPG